MGAPDATLDDAGDGAITLLDGGAFPDSYVDSNVDPVVLGDAGGLFLCGSNGAACICDGRTHYCDDSSGPGGAPILGDASDFGDASACGDASWSACVGFPAPCVSQPSCKCLLDIPRGVCACRLDDSGAGLIYGYSIP